MEACCIREIFLTHLRSVYHHANLGRCERARSSVSVGMYLYAMKIRKAVI